MSSPIQPLADSIFLDAFEKQTLDPVYFNHLGHLRLSWLYTRDYPIDIAVAKACSGIRSYALALGQPGKYHQTVTEALVRIVAQRAKGLKEAEWHEFLRQNRDLVEQAYDLLLKYYSEPVINSKEARTQWIEPDIKSLA